MDYKIGIGVTSYARQAHLDLWRNQIFKHTHKVDVQEIVGTEGIANAKNKCLNSLKDCDYIFLFDDDCFPIKDGWAEYFIEEHKRTGNHHFMYLNHTHQYLGTLDGIDVYKQCGGCFMFLTKEVIDKVGYYYDQYGKYGYEHAGYTNRIHQAGLTPSGMYLSPEKSNEYLHSLDLDLPIFDIKHKPSLPICQVIKGVEENKKVYLEDIKQIYRTI